MQDKEQEQQLEEILEDLEKAATQEEAVEETVEATENSEVEETDEAEAPDGEEAEETTEKETSKKKIFGKKKVDKKEEAYKEKIAELDDKVKRQMAEFENFRRRTEKEKSQMFEAGARSVIEKILPTIDNFERGLATVSDEDKDSAFAEGMNMVYKQLLTELEAIGVKAIEAVGQPFDPNLHNAVMQDADSEGESGTVTQELQKGYTYRDGVVRHSMVAVKN